MNMTKAMWNWCLALVSIALLTAAGVASAAPGAKYFYAAGANGGVTFPGDGVVGIFVKNTSTAPATINTVVLCNGAGITFNAGTLGAGGPAGNVVSTAFCGAGGGVLLKDFTGLRRGESAIFYVPATVAGATTCPSTTSIGPVKAYASTGNTTSFTAEFTGTDSSGTSLGVNYVEFSLSAECSGEIGCSSTNNFVPPAIANPDSVGTGDPRYAESTRGPQNSNGTACVVVPYVFENRIGSMAGDGEIFLVWPQGGDQRRATFRTYFNGNAKPAPTDGTYPALARPKVAWEFDGTGAPIKITDALTCLEDSFPLQYGVLTANISNTAVSATIDFGGTAPLGGWKPLPANNGVPFAVNVEEERMIATVTSRTATTATLSLTRAQGLTAAVAHASGKAFISTPFPVDPRPYGTGAGQSPYSGQAVRICIAQQGIQIYTPDPTTGAPRYFDFFEYYDGDGWIGGFD